MTATLPKCNASHWFRYFQVMWLVQTWWLSSYSSILPLSLALLTINILQEENSDWNLNFPISVIKNLRNCSSLYYEIVTNLSITANVYIHEYDHSEPDHVINFHVNCHPGESFNQKVATNFRPFSQSFRKGFIQHHHGSYKVGMRSMVALASLWKCEVRTNQIF